MKRISIIGSTGSIGVQALEIAGMHKIKINALAAHSNTELLEKQAREFNPESVCIYNKDMYPDLKQRLHDTGVNILCGMDGLCETAALPGTDMLVNSVVGMVGLLPTLTAIEAGIDVALANKETLVAGGDIVMKLAKKKNVNILPVDSEHSAIFQALQGNNIMNVKKIILTASGGPFFGKSRDELNDVTLSGALAHPVWNMGKKISIDSATLMNKGLELIEAKWLFGLKPEQIDVLVHREGVLHSAVEYIDNSIIAQLGEPDMRLPIQYALLYPKRVKGPVKSLSLTDCGSLTFKRPDYETFKCLKLCIDALKKGGGYPCIVNAANEAAVQKFINSEITFLEIAELVSKALEHFEYSEIKCYDDVVKLDEEARNLVNSYKTA